MTDEELLLWLRLEDTNLTDFAADRIEELLAERKKDHANINLKADFIDKTINQLAEADAKLAECEARLGKAVELALEECPFREGTGSYNDWWHDRRATLAEISSHNKGESHDPL